MGRTESYPVDRKRYRWVLAQQADSTSLVTGDDLSDPLMSAFLVMWRWPPVFCPRADSVVHASPVPLQVAGGAGDRRLVQAKVECRHPPPRRFEHLVSDSLAWLESARMSDFRPNLRNASIRFLRRRRRRR